MRKEARRPRTAGFALTEALVSLLLLALVLGGASRALVAALADQQAVLQELRAADLATDLAEALRAAADADAAQAQLALWHRQLAQVLPGASATLQPGPGITRVALQWQSPHALQTADFALAVPLASAAPP